MTTQVVDAVPAFVEKLDELTALFKRTQAERERADADGKKVLDERLAKIEAAQKDVDERVKAARRLSLPGVELAKDENDKPGKAFSWGRMAKLCMTPKTLLDEPEYGYERDVYRDMRKAYAGLDPVVKAQLDAGTGESGAFLIPTEVMSTIVPILREVSILRGLGATVFSSLVGNVVWTRQATDVTAYHVNTEQAEAITTSSPKFERIEMRPHVLAALVPITWEMRTQAAISLEDFVKQSIAAQIGLAQDQKAFLGLGAASEPRGLKNHPDVQTFNWTSTAPDYGSTAQNITDKLISIWKLVRKKSALFGRLGWAASPDALAKLATTKDKDFQPIFGTPGQLIPSSFLRPDYPVRDSELLDDTADADETLIFGNYADAVIGEWGTLAFAMSETSGTDFETMRARLRGAMAWDFAVWHGSSFVNVDNLAA